MNLPSSGTAAHPLTIRIFVPGMLRSRLNGTGSRAHWSSLSHDAYLTKERTTVAWMLAGRPTWSGHAQVTFTAYVGQLWDDDDLPAALKVHRDVGVGLVLGWEAQGVGKDGRPYRRAKDGPKSGNKFIYQQEVRPANARGVLIEISPLTREGVHHETQADHEGAAAHQRSKSGQGAHGPQPEGGPPAHGRRPGG